MDFHFDGQLLEMKSLNDHLPLNPSAEYEGQITQIRNLVLTILSQFSYLDC